MKFTLFADDTSITCFGSDMTTLARTLNSELKLVSTSLLSRKLSLDTQTHKKTHFIVFAGNKQFHEIFGNKEFNEICSTEIGNQNIQRVDSVKYLEIYIDHKLTWKEHINYMHSKLSNSLGILHKVKHVLTQTYF